MDDQRTDRERGGSMSPKDAQQILHSATWDDYGTFLLLRLGEDPGPDPIAQLRRAIFELWLNWKDKPALPFELVHDAASILNFAPEAIRNLRGNVARPEIFDELGNLVAAAYCFLTGPYGEQTWGRNGEQWIP
jgi:hypothetical protein